MNNIRVTLMKKEMLEECVDLFISVFSKEPWNDVYDSRDQVKRFFENHFNNNYFLGYVALINDEIVALSVGMTKPWINGMEYYIDEFCVKYDLHGSGIGSEFMKQIVEALKLKNINDCILLTETGLPAEKFYKKNGFKTLENLIVMGK